MCTGIFITNVLPDSRAHKSGLKPGYQILKINAFPLKESTHEETVSLLTLKRAYILTCKDIGQLLSYIMRKFQKYSSFFFFFQNLLKFVQNKKIPNISFSEKLQIYSSYKEVVIIVN